ncbi:DUF2264 domain-containing protein [Cellulomonas sp. URHE0023]|uniref:DUF2264 domain-containing protein n=1 Tax=Cellulomonas sp. URHE0023 TaxID=1380354 RepID=UPI0009DF6CE8|nr:DUF2264 domain-containing protein [Cellulomonas sp. URHE0023]
MVSTQRTATADAGVPQGASALTHWRRDDWTRLADQMLAAVRPFASPRHALITLPGAPGGYGTAVDGLEGFARTFLLAGFRLAGEHGDDPQGLAEYYAAGIAAGVDPGSPERWVRLDQHPQAKVEAASVALILDLTRPWIWDRLSARTQAQVVDYLAPAVGDATYPRINWVWFRLVVQTFLRSVGGPWSSSDVAEDLATHDSFARADGWMADGPERSYDHYVGWALHLYPTLWSRMSGAAELAQDRRARDVAALDRFLLDAVRLVGSDGSPLIQGRSLAYRFAAAAPFWVGALAGVPSVGPGLLRRAASGIVSHFGDHAVPDENGLLTLGWHDAWPRIAQSYSGPSSPYWASKGMLGIALPSDHPVWLADEEPLPVERADFTCAVTAPGWAVSGTRADGIVRVANHGTDHALPGSSDAESPLYARIGYSTATSPLLDEDAWTDPLEQSVALIDEHGRASHRTGMTLLRCEVSDGVAVAASRAHAHWVRPSAAQEQHGSGWTGTAEPAGAIVVTSLLRGPWEVRLVQVESLAPGVVELRVGGWPVTDGRLVSLLEPVLGTARSAAVVRRHASPLGDDAHVPVLTFPVRAGDLVAVTVTLGHPPTSTGKALAPVALHRLPDDQVDVTWPDGSRTRHRTA